MLVCGGVELRELVEAEVTVAVNSANVLSENSSWPQLSGDEISTGGYNAK
jgi:hypothetical protein